MLPSTPYKVSYKGYDLLVQQLHIETIGYIEHVSTFHKDVFPITHINGEYSDKETQKSCEVVVTISMSTTDVSDATVKLWALFNVSRDEAIKIPEICVTLARYGFEMINNYIVERPLIDKNGYLFPLPKFPYSEGYFGSVVFE